MDISIKEPGWEKFEWEDITVEVKRLTSEEGLDLQGDLASLEGENVFSDKIKAYFTKYARNIEGLKINGKAIKEPAKLLDPSIGRSPIIERFYIAVINHFFAVNTVAEDERKNFKEPPEDTNTPAA
jgi:hypothetical protein